MKYAIIENFKVVNTVVADAPMGENWIQSDDAGVGWIWDGQNLCAPAVKVISRKDVITARLLEIDSTTDKPRTRRELALNKGPTKAWLQTLDDEAIALRTELAGL